MRSIQTFSAALAAAFLFCSLCAAELPSTARIKTIRSLAMDHEDIYARYVSADAKTGELKLQKFSDQNQSGSFWRIRRTFTFRGYHKVYVLQNRMNGRLNGSFLGIDPKFGNPEMNWTRNRETTNWHIRYAGKHHGWDAYIIQNIDHTPGLYDMQFLSVDTETKHPALKPKLDDTSFWFIRVVDDLPTEIMGDQGISAWADGPGVGWY